MSVRLRRARVIWCFGFVAVVCSPVGTGLIGLVAAANGSSVPNPSAPLSVDQKVGLRFESRIADVNTTTLQSVALAVLNDPRGWSQAGFSFYADSASPYRVILDEGAKVDALCDPLGTGGLYSCQNGPIVAFNATRWRQAFKGWDVTLEEYRQYMVNHEVGHLFGQRHPQPRCPIVGGRAAVMEQQSKGLAGCRGNAWPLSWEITRAAARPIKWAPPPEWHPDPVPVNLGDATSPGDETVASATKVASTLLEAATSLSEVVTTVVASAAAGTSEDASNGDAPASTSTPGYSAPSESAGEGAHGGSSGGVLVAAGVGAGVLVLAAVGLILGRSRRTSAVGWGRRPRVVRPTQPPDLYVEAYGMQSLTETERTAERISVSLIFPRSDSLLSGAQAKPMLRALLEGAESILDAPTPKESLTELSALLVELCDRHRVSGGVLIVGADEAHYATIGSVGVAIEGPCGKRQLLTTEGPFVSALDPSDEIFVLFAGRARTMFANSVPTPSPIEPEAFELFRAAADRNRSHPFVVVARTRPE